MEKSNVVPFNKPDGHAPVGSAAHQLDVRRVESGDWWHDETLQNQLAAIITYQPRTAEMEQVVDLLTPEDFRPLMKSPESDARWIAAECALEHFEKYREPIGDGILAAVQKYDAAISTAKERRVRHYEYCRRLKQYLPAAVRDVIQKAVGYKSGRLLAGALEDLNQANLSGHLSVDKFAAAVDGLQERLQPREKSLVDAPQWPQRPDWESPAFYGIAGDIVRAIDPLTEADPVAVLAQFLVGFGCMVGHRPYLTLDADEHHANVHVCLVGGTGEGRKGTALTRAKQVLAWVDPLFVKQRCFGGVASGQAMIKEVCDDLFRKDKEGKPFLAQAGTEDKRWLMTESEFGRTLTMCRSENSILSHVIREGFDSGNLRNTAIGNPLIATAAHISLVGHVTQGELSSLLKNTTLHLNGFCNRILFICCAKSKELRRGGRRTVPGWQAFQERLLAAYEWARKVDRVVWSESAMELWSTAGYDEVTRVHGNVLDEITNRGNSIVPRLAAIQAILNGCHAREQGKALIRREHLEAALALWRYSVASSRFIFGSAATLDPDGRKVLEVLEECGSASRSDLSLKAFQNNDPRRRLASALSLLQRKGLVRVDVVKTAGRDCEVWSRVNP